MRQSSRLSAYTGRMQVLQRGMTSANSPCLLCSVWILMPFLFLSAVKTETTTLNTTPSHTVLQGEATTVHCDYNKTSDMDSLSVALSREQTLCSYLYIHKSWLRRSCEDNIRLIWTPGSEEISYELLNLQISNSGVYTCTVERQIPPPVKQLGVQRAFIHVIARPAVSATCVKGSDGAPTLLCTSEGFYPAALEQVWIRDEEFITYMNSSLTNREYLNSSKGQLNSSTNTDGSHSLTSYLHLSPTPEQVLYSCWVNHSSLSQPITINISSSECNETGEGMRRDVFLIVTCVSSAVLTGIIIFLAACCHHLRKKRTCPRSPVGRPLLPEHAPNIQLQTDVYSTLGNHHPIPCRTGSNYSTAVQYREH